MLDCGSRTTSCSLARFKFVGYGQYCCTFSIFSLSHKLDSGEPKVEPGKYSKNTKLIFNHRFLCAQRVVRFTVSLFALNHEARLFLVISPRFLFYNLSICTCSILQLLFLNHSLFLASNISHDEIFSVRLSPDIKIATVNGGRAHFLLKCAN